MKTDEEIRALFNEYFDNAENFSLMQFFSYGIRSVEMEYFNRLKEMERENHQLRESMRII